MPDETIHGIDGPTPRRDGGLIVYVLLSQVSGSAPGWSASRHKPPLPIFPVDEDVAGIITCLMDVPGIVVRNEDDEWIVDPEFGCVLNRGRNERGYADPGRHRQADSAGTR